MIASQEILLKAKEMFPLLVNFGEGIIIDNILCLPCDISNNINYFIIYPNGEIKYKTKDHWEYISAFNKEGYGNGIVFIDLNIWEIIKIYYFKDDLSYDYPIEIDYSNNDFMIIPHEERTHIIFLDNFSVSSFGGGNYKVYEPYVLFFPYWGYSGYDTFAVIDTSTKKRIDLNQKLASIILNDIGGKTFRDFFEPLVSIDENRENLVYQYRHSGEIFKLNLLKLFEDNDELDETKLKKVPVIKHSNIQVLEGGWIKGFSLDIHTIKSAFMYDGAFETERTYIGELLYNIKYRFDRSKIKELVEIITSEFHRLFGNQIDVIVPVPPSNLKRPFQPLFEIAKELSSQIQIPVEFDLIVKNKVIPSIKQFNEPEKRKQLLSNAFTAKNKSYKGKTILLFDDLYRSGETLNTISNVLKNEVEVGDIYVLTITKTRSNK